MEGRARKTITPEQSEMIELIAKRNSRNTFAYFSEEDISQEIRMICLKALAGFQPGKGPLENYLQRCVTNRLKNLRRDKYFRPTANQCEGARDRINIVNALPLGGGDISPDGRPMGSSSYGGDPVEAAIQAEMQEYIDTRLAPEDLADLERMRSGDRLPGPRVEQLRFMVGSLLEQYNDG